MQVLTFVHPTTSRLFHIKISNLNSFDFGKKSSICLNVHSPMEWLYGSTWGLRACIVLFLFVLMFVLLFLCVLQLRAFVPQHSEQIKKHLLQSLPWANNQQRTTNDSSYNSSHEHPAAFTSWTSGHCILASS